MGGITCEFQIAAEVFHSQHRVAVRSRYSQPSGIDKHECGASVSTHIKVPVVVAYVKESLIGSGERFDIDIAGRHSDGSVDIGSTLGKKRENQFCVPCASTGG